ncbi:MAG: Sir2 family NAD-dependent protein deacetylase [Pseudomonadota bacterium]
MMPATAQTAAEKLTERIGEAQRVVVFTGAGISTDSGIDDFRSPGGIWSKIKPIEFSQFQTDEQARREDWRRRFHFQASFDAAQPNSGHLGIATLLARDNGGVLITQNIDGLHQRAGVPDEQMIEIHGNGTRASCLECSSPMSLTEARAYIEREDQAPRCRRCDGLVKADIISFGQPMPSQKLASAEQHALGCDVMLVAGSSLVVQPAATLPLIAKNNGAYLAIINRDTTPLDSLADLRFGGSISDTLRLTCEYLEA